MITTICDHKIVHDPTRITGKLKTAGDLVAGQGYQQQGSLLTTGLRSY
jgi:hypothetical protein